MSTLAEPIEALVRDRVIELLSSMSDDVEAEYSDDESLRDALAQLAVTQEQLQRVEDDYYLNGVLSEGRYRQLRTALEAREEGIKRGITEAATNRSLRGVPLKADELAVAWDAGSLAWKRNLIDAVLERIVVKKATRRGKFDPERLEMLGRSRVYGEGGIKPKRKA